MTIIDAITSSPLNLFFTFVIGIGLVYLYYRKPSSSSSSSTSASSSATHPIRTFTNNSAYRSAATVGPTFVDEQLRRAIAQIEREERDMIRQEQDAAYQQSLKADKEKKLKREEELRDKEAKEKAEREQKETQELLRKRLTNLKSEITDKLPSFLPNGKEATVKLVFKLPDGSRVKQEFSTSSHVKYLYWFVFSLENAPLRFKLTTNFPKRDLPGRSPIPEDFKTNNGSGNGSTEPNCELTLEAAGLTETQIIFVYDLEA